MSSITWPKSDRLTFFGRNGTSFCCGITLYYLPSRGHNGRIVLTPHTSLGRETKACDVDLPAEPAVLRDLAAHLSLLAQKIEQAPGFKPELQPAITDMHGNVEFIGIDYNEEKAA
jgi:hypothetical protein